MATLTSFTLEGYNAEGHKAALTFTAAAGDVRQEVIDAANQMWAAGIRPAREAWMQQHEFEVCDTVLLRQKENGDGSFTPLVVMYPAAPYLNRKFLHEYLDTPQQRAEFEALIGRKLSSLPVYPNTIYPDHGGPKAKPSDTQYFVKVQPFGVLKRVPEQGDSDETREKHRLVRFVPIVSDSQSVSVNTAQVRADLGGGDQPRILGRSEQTTPADVKAAANALNTPPTSDPTFDEMFPKGGSNPFNRNLPASQPPADKSSADIKDALVEKVFVQQNRDGGVSYVLQPANVIIYSRDALRSCDVPCEDWQPGRQAHVLANKLRVKYTLDGTAKKFVALERVAA